MSRSLKVWLGALLRLDRPIMSFQLEATKYFFAWIFLIAKVNLAGSTLSFHVGACGYFSEHSKKDGGHHNKTVRHLMPFVAKVAFQEALMDDVDNVPGLDIKLRLAGCRCNPKIASQVALPLFLGEGKQVGRIHSMNELDPVLAITSIVCSSVSQALSPMAAALGTPLVAATATNPQLSNKDLHPFFTRLQPTDSFLAKGLARLVQYFGSTAPLGGWQRIACVYQQDGAVMDATSQVFTVELGKLNPGINVFREPLPHFTGNHDEFYESALPFWTQAEAAAHRIAQLKPRIRVYILLLFSLQAGVHLQAFKEAGLVTQATSFFANDLVCMDNVFFGFNYADFRVRSPGTPEAQFWTRYDWSHAAIILDGTVCLNPKSFGPFLYSQRFFNFWTNLSCDKLVAAGKTQEWFDSDCHPGMFKDLTYLTSDPGYTYAFDSNILVFAAISSLLKMNHPPASIRGSLLLEQIKGIRFEGLSGTVSLDSAGDRLGSYIVDNIQKSRSSGHTLVSVGEYNGASNLLSFTSPPLFRNRTTTVSADKPEPCRKGHVYQESTLSCIPCPLGSFSYGGTSACRDCEPGYFGNGHGKSACRACHIGSFSNVSGSTSSLNCLPCPRGRFSYGATSVCVDCELGTFQNATGAFECLPCDAGKHSYVGQPTCTDCLAGKSTEGALGSQECTKCRPGHFANLRGQFDCSDCSIGRYSNRSGQSACLECGSKKATMRKLQVRGSHEWVLFSSSDSEDDCKCEFGHRPDEDNCILCEQSGLICNGDVRISSGYYADVDMSVFICRPANRCKGGIAGDTCEYGRSGIACDQCDPGMIPGEGGRCAYCHGSDLVPFILCTIALMLALFCMYYVVDSRNLASTSHLLLMPGIAFGQLIAIVQLFSIIGLLWIDFPELVRTFLDVMQLFTFEIDIIRLGCVADLSPLTSFMSKNLILPIVGLVCGAIHCLFVIFRHNGDFRSRYSSLIAILGTLFSVCFVSVVSATIAPFQCDEHPNKKRTVHKHQSVLCWDSDEHVTMVVTGIVFGLFIPFTFLAFCALIVHKYPSKIYVMDTNFLQSYSFLFARVKPDTHWYSLLILSRSLLIGLIPTIPHAATQISLLQTAVVVMLITTIYFYPWRVSVNNYLDVGSSIAIILFLTVAALFVDNDSDMESSAWICTICLMVTLLSFPGLVCSRLAKAFFFSNKQFAFFLCHHKLGAGAYVRLLKSFLVEHPKTRGKVFIDCDDLSNLETLFDIVGNDVGRLLVVCSKSVLFRPWCVGEITTAHTKNVAMTMIQLPEFGGIESATIEAYDSHIEDIRALAGFGISLEMIKAALNFVRVSPKIIVPETLNIPIMLALAKTLIVGDAFRIPENSDTQSVHSFTVICDTDVLEAVAAGLLLQKMFLLIDLPVDMASQRGYTSRGSSSKAQRVQTVITLFNAGCLERTALPLFMIEAAREEIGLLPVLLEEGFRPPTASILRDLRDRSPIREHEIEPGEFAGIVTNIFLLIAREFPVNVASEAYLKMQCKVIASHLQDPTLPRSSNLSRNSTAENMLAFTTVSSLPMEGISSRQISEARSSKSRNVSESSHKPQNNITSANEANDMLEDDGEFLRQSRGRDLGVENSPSSTNSAGVAQIVPTMARDVDAHLCPCLFDL